MIRRHDFNSEWCGQEVGIVAEDAFFDLAASERDEQLAPWAWVEARSGAAPQEAARRAAAGFFQVDVQVRFRIGLARLESSPSVDRLDVVSAEEAELHVAPDELADFAHERFLAVPGIDAAALNRRYARWGADLIASDPALALEVRLGDVPQGWFLSRRTSAGLELTLAMLRRGAEITGHHLYHKALLAYGARGERVGAAAFSVTNTAVHNVYASLGARFLEPEACWLWHA